MPCCPWSWKFPEQPSEQRSRLSGAMARCEPKVSSPPAQRSSIRAASGLAASCASPPLQQPSNQRRQLPVRAVSARLHLETEQIFLHLAHHSGSGRFIKQTHTNAAVQGFLCLCAASAAEIRTSSCVLDQCVWRDAVKLRAEQDPGLMLGGLPVVCSVNVSAWMIYGRYAFWEGAFLLYKDWSKNHQTVPDFNRFNRLEDVLLMCSIICIWSNGVHVMLSMVLKVSSTTE